MINNSYFEEHLRTTVSVLQNIKKDFHKNEKMANRKSGKIGKVGGNPGKIIRSFLISEFSILPYSLNRKLGFKNHGKKFQRFPGFRPSR